MAAGRPGRGGGVHGAGGAAAHATAPSGGAGGPAPGGPADCNWVGGGHLRGGRGRPGGPGAPCGAAAGPPRYLTGVWGMASVPGAPSFKKLRAGFAHSLIPIALAYLIAHYFSLFVFQEQAQFTYLLSDPLGTGTTDLFGTASSGIDFQLLNANAIWYVQVGALVIGHVIGLTLAHDRATAYWGDYRQAARSQYWMLAVMVAFSRFGLSLLSGAYAFTRHDQEKYRNAAYA